MTILRNDICNSVPRILKIFDTMHSDVSLSKESTNVLRCEMREKKKKKKENARVTFARFRNRRSIIRADDAMSQRYIHERDDPRCASIVPGAYLIGTSVVDSQLNHGLSNNTGAR